MYVCITLHLLPMLLILIYATGFSGIQDDQITRELINFNVNNYFLNALSFNAKLSTN